jgi:hypothetical protein
METQVAEILKTVCQWLVLATIIAGVAVRYWQCRHLGGEPDEKESFAHGHAGGEPRPSCDLLNHTAGDVKIAFGLTRDVQPGNRLGRAIGPRQR